MKLLDNYIFKTVLVSILAVLSVLVMLDLLTDFIREMDQVGRGNYTFFEAVIYIVLTRPTSIYRFLPLSVLLGAIIGLGILASSSELTVMRASGISLLRIIGSVMRVGLVLMLVSFSIGEFIVPHAEEYAENRRSLAISNQITLKSRFGFWARDGLSYINIRSVKSSNVMGDIYIFEFDNKHQLRVSTHAREATYENNSWTLHDISQSRISQAGVKSTHSASAEWGTLLDPGLIDVVVVNPDQLSALSLHRYINYLEQNGQETDRYKLAFWLKVMTPLSVAVMIMLAVPFVFGPLRSVSIGQRIMVGFMTGLVFHLMNQGFAQLGLVYKVSAFLSAALPLLLFLGISLILIRRVR
jgi:lipopolysaccharide export system permease protein